MLGSVHEVQRFHKDADGTKEWIEKKNQALNTDNYGHDLASLRSTEPRETHRARALWENWAWRATEPRETHRAWAIWET